MTELFEILMLTPPLRGSVVHDSNRILYIVRQIVNF